MVAKRESMGGFRFEVNRINRAVSAVRVYNVGVGGIEQT